MAWSDAARAAALAAKRAHSSTRLALAKEAKWLRHALPLSWTDDAGKKHTLRMYKGNLKTRLQKRNEAVRSIALTKVGLRVGPISKAAGFHREPWSNVFILQNPKKKK